MSEFFRHLRPVWFDPKRVEIKPLSHGGLSFLFRPTDLGKYDFWLVICPSDIVFSAHGAVAKLRHIANNGVVPYGTIELNGESVTDLALRQILDHPLQGMLVNQAHDIYRSILLARQKKQEALNSTKRNQYEER